MITENIDDFYTCPKCGKREKKPVFSATRCWSCFKKSGDYTIGWIGQG